MARSVLNRETRTSNHCFEVWNKMYSVFFRINPGCVYWILDIANPVFTWNRRLLDRLRWRKAHVSAVVTWSSHGVFKELQFYFYKILKTLAVWFLLGIKTLCCLDYLLFCDPTRIYLKHSILTIITHTKPDSEGKVCTLISQLTSWCCLIVFTVKIYFFLPKKQLVRHH